MLQENEIYSWFNDLRTGKAGTLRLMKEVDEFFTPTDDALCGSSTVGQGLLKGELLDTTGSDLIDEYVSFVLGLQYNSEDRWFNLKVSSEDDQSDNNKILAKRAEVLFTLINNSNYYPVLSQIERDSMLHGHGLMKGAPCEEKFVKWLSGDPRSILLGQDSFYSIYCSMWFDILSYMELKVKFPSLVIEEEITKDISTTRLNTKYVLLSVFTETKPPFFNEEDKNEENMNAKFMIRYVAFPEPMLGEVDLQRVKLIRIDEVEYIDYKNVFPTRDKLVRNCSYGMGIGRRALTKSRMVNKSIFNLMKLAGLQANPPRIQHPQISGAAGVGQGSKTGYGDDGGLQEGQVITATQYTSDGMDPKSAVQLLQVTGDLTALLQIYQLQQNALITMLPTSSNIYKVARQSITEIQERLSEQEKRLGPIRKNFLLEGPMEHLKYMYWLAEKQGRFNREDLKLGEGVSKIEFSFSSNFLSSYRQGKALRLAQALGISGNFLTLQPSGIDNFNIDRVIETVFDGYGVVDQLEPRAIVARKRAIQRQQMEQQQAMEQQQLSLQANADTAKIMEAVANMNRNVQ